MYGFFSYLFVTTSIEDISEKLYLTDCSLHRYRTKINLGTVTAIRLQKIMLKIN